MLKQLKHQLFFLSPQVHAETVMGYYGECQTLADMKIINITLALTGKSLKCPSVLEAWTDFKCTLEVDTGMDLDIELKTPFGDVYNATMEGSLSL